jgi:hypothetical protein
MALRIPNDAYSFEIFEPIPLRMSLNDAVRPVIGGVQMEWQRTSTSTPECTVGFNAYTLISARRVFATNSHCTTKRGEVATGTDKYFYQPLIGAGNLIGSEYEDPPLFDCPAYTQPCRYSDAALIEYASGVDWDFGGIAGTGTGSVLINDRYQIVGEVTSPIAGEELSRLGMVTGRANGLVTTETCKDVPAEMHPWNPTTVVMLCQDKVGEVDVAMSDGDSGGPVFGFKQGSTWEVYLYGLAWGGGSSYFWMSSLGMIEMEDFMGDGDLITF